MRLIYSLFNCIACFSNTPLITVIPADFNFLKLFPPVNGFGSFIAQTTVFIFDFIIKSTQGGHFPQLLHGSKLTYNVAPSTFTGELFIACASA